MNGVVLSILLYLTFPPKVSLKCCVWGWVCSLFSFFIDSLQQNHSLLDMLLTSTSTFVTQTCVWDLNSSIQWPTWFIPIYVPSHRCLKLSLKNSSHQTLFFQHSLCWWIMLLSVLTSGWEIKLPLDFSSIFASYIQVLTNLYWFSSQITFKNYPLSSISIATIITCLDHYKIFPAGFPASPVFPLK